MYERLGKELIYLIIINLQLFLFNSVCFILQYNLKKPDAVMLRKNNDMIPFEDVTPIETLSKKQDASLFVFGSHSKKRPNNLVLGKVYFYI